MSGVGRGLQSKVRLLPHPPRSRQLAGDGAVSVTESVPDTGGQGLSEFCSSLPSLLGGTGDRERSGS